MVNVAEDINIGADASQAISEFRKLESAVISSMEAAGASTKQLDGITRQLDRVFANIAGTAVRGSTQISAAMKAEVRSTETAITAAEKLARARQQATAKTGLGQNATGQVIDTSTGRFASKDNQARYAQEVALQQRLIENEGRLDRQRAINAQNQFARDRQAIQSSNQVSESYRKRQQELERVFSGSIVGLANPNATGLQKFANILQQIPPATWAERMRGASEAVMGMSNSTRYALYEVANSATVAGAAFIAFGAFSIGAAVAHERAFANVARTTQTTTEGYEVLRRQLEVMSMELPITYEELTNIATAAGQLGIGASGVAAFTRTVAQLTATTNLTSDAAGIALARFRTFFSEVNDGRGPQGLAVTDATFNNLASSILKVGVNSIASETGIVNVATQIASMGDYAGLTANQVIGLAGALSSIGVAPELARGTITRTFSLIGNAVSDGGVKLEKFAKLAGVSGQEFHDAWGTEDFAGIFTRMMKGISEYGGDANLMLQELGFNSVRDRPLLLRLAGAADEAGVAGGLLAQTLSDAYEGWTKNSELALQYSKISTTTAARVQVLGQTFEQLAASLGQQSGGFLGELAVQLTGVLRGFEEFSNSDVGQVMGTIAVQGALAAGALLLIVGGASRSAASIQAIGQAWSSFSDIAVSGATKAAAAFRIMTAAMGIVGILGTIAALVGGMIAMGDASAKAKRGVQDFGGLVSAMRNDAENGANGITFYADANAAAAAEQKRSSEQAKGMTEALYGVKDSAEGGADGMDALAASSERARYVFGESAKEFYRSQLAQSETFQSLFDPSKSLNAFGNTFKDLGIDKVDIDWDKLMDDSLKGGINKDQLLNTLMEQTGIKRFGENGEFTESFKGLQNWVNTAVDAYGNLTPEIQKTLNAEAALEGQSAQTFSEIYDGATDATGAISELDETTQKTVDAIAQGFAKFTDTSSLIGLTQKMNEIFGQVDVSDTDKAAQWEQAWTDAYGGAAFSLEEYLGVYRRAGQEQSGFIENLTSLRERLSTLGLSDAFINDLAQMGPEAASLVDALISGTDTQLAEFENLWGQTGYDSMVMFATQAAIGQQITSAVLRNAGLDGLRQFNSALSSGVGVDEALGMLQLDVNGNPIKPKLDKPNPPPNLTEWEKQQWANANRLSTTATVRVSAINGGAGVQIGGKTVTPFASGGWTGPGSKYQEAGVVHADEFVFTKEATRAIGVGNLYALMNSAQSGRAAPKGRGYAQGGLVSGNSGPSVVYLSPEDRQLLRSLQPILRIGDRDIAQAQSDANFRNKRQGVG